MVAVTSSTDEMDNIPFRLSIPLVELPIAYFIKSANCCREYEEDRSKALSTASPSVHDSIIAASPGTVDKVSSTILNISSNIDQGNTSKSSGSFC